MTQQNYASCIPLGKVFNTANFLVNNSPANVNVGHTPEELFSGTKPDMSYLRVLGCDM